MRNRITPPSCARPQCGNIKDSRPWCPVCNQHINSTDDPDHQHHKQ